MWQRLATRHVAKFFLGCEVGFESFNGPGQFRREWIVICGQHTGSCRSRTRRAESEEMPPCDLLMLAEEAFGRIHGAGSYFPNAFATKRPIGRHGAKCLCFVLSIKSVKSAVNSHLVPSDQVRRLGVLACWKILKLACFSPCTRKMPHSRP